MGSCAAKLRRPSSTADSKETRERYKTRGSDNGNNGGDGGAKTYLRTDLDADNCKTAESIVKDYYPDAVLVDCVRITKASGSSNPFLQSFANILKKTEPLDSDSRRFCSVCGVVSRRQLINDIQLFGRMQQFGFTRLLAAPETVADCVNFLSELHQTDFLHFTELQAAEALQTALNNSSLVYDPVKVVGFSHKVMYANPAYARLVGFRLEDIMGKDLNELPHPPISSEWTPVIQAHVSNGQRWHGICRLKHRSGTSIENNCQVIPVHVNGSISHIVFIANPTSSFNASSPFQFPGRRRHASESTEVDEFASKRTSNSNVQTIAKSCNDVADSAYSTTVQQLQQDDQSNETIDHHESLPNVVTVQQGTPSRSDRCTSLMFENDIQLMRATVANLSTTAGLPSVACVQLDRIQDSLDILEIMTAFATSSDDFDSAKLNSSEMAAVLRRQQQRMHGSTLLHAMHRQSESSESTFTNTLPSVPTSASGFTVASSLERRERLMACGSSSSPGDRRKFIRRSSGPISTNRSSDLSDTVQLEQTLFDRTICSPSGVSTNRSLLETVPSVDSNNGRSDDEENTAVATKSNSIPSERPTAARVGRSSDAMLTSNAAGTVATRIEIISRTHSASTMSKSAIQAENERTAKHHSSGCRPSPGIYQRPKHNSLTQSDSYTSPQTSIDLDDEQIADGFISGLMTVKRRFALRNCSADALRRLRQSSGGSLKSQYALSGIEIATVLPEEPNEEMSALLSKSLGWDFDVIELEKLSGKRPLVYLGQRIFDHFGVNEFLNCPQDVSLYWLTVIEAHYRSENNYHNSTHAADVLQATAYMLETPQMKHICEKNQAGRAALLIATIVHDVDHPGRTNPFQVNAQTDLALLYNDRSVLENHHCSLTFRLTVKDEKANIFKHIEPDTFKTLREYIIELVMATDMSRHFELNKVFRNSVIQPLDQFYERFVSGMVDTSSVKILEVAETSPALSRAELAMPTQKMSSGTPTPQRRRSSAAAVEDGFPSSLASAASKSTAVTPALPVDFPTPEQLSVTLKILIKSADISNPCRPRSLCIEWAKRIAEEYFAQTQDEKARGLPVVMPGFDRQTCHLPQTQTGFITLFVLDLFQMWHSLSPIPEIITQSAKGFSTTVVTFRPGADKRGRTFVRNSSILTTDVALLP